MSNSDSFIDEVNEELKRDRLFAAMKKYGWIAIVLVVAIVGWAAWNEWAKARQVARAQAFGDALIAALEPDEAAVRRAGLDALMAEIGPDRSRAAVLNLLRAAAAIEDGDRATALAALQQVSDDAALPASYRQLATLKRVLAATPEDIPRETREALIAPLTAAGSPFRPLALEQQALLRLEAGDTAGALAGFAALLDEPDLSPGLRNRVMQLIVILGGTLPQRAG